MSLEIGIKSFGAISRGEELELALRALSELREERAFRYYLVGESEDWPGVRELVRRHELLEHVMIEEQASPARVQEHIATTDIALCLHEGARSHHASKSEGLLYQVMSAGVPALVLDRGWVAELPTGAVVKIDADHYAEQLLKAYLDRLMTDSSLRERIGACARRYVRALVPAPVAGARENTGPAAANTGPASELVQNVNGRFGKIEGLDYKRGAVLYPERLDASNRHHLLTKPFYNLAHKISRWEGAGVDEDTRRQFCDFANMAVTLALAPGARILDVGCGSGWLSEYFSRLGYRMTGVDISPALVEMARERLRKVPYGVDQETPLSCRFLVHDIESSPLDETFDAVICYDALHHFEDERAVLRHLAAMLDYGGTLFVLEGERPPAGSATERELRDVMMEYETLESPFGHEYLRELLVQHGFAITGDYVSVNDLFERELMNEDGSLLVRPAPVNYLLCKRLSLPEAWTEAAATQARARSFDTRAPHRLGARWSVRGEWSERVSPGAQLALMFEVENTGDTLWLVSRAPLKGTVRVGWRVIDENEAILEEVHGVPPLPRAVVPSEEVSLELKLQAPAARGRYTLKLDLVVQDICWFEQHGSTPLLLHFEVE